MSGKKAKKNLKRSRSGEVQNKIEAINEGIKKKAKNSGLICTSKSQYEGSIKEIGDLGISSAVSSLKKYSNVPIENKASSRNKRMCFLFPFRLEIKNADTNFGVLHDLNTLNPKCYIEIPNSKEVLKLNGTLIYPKSKFMSIQTRLGKKATLISRGMFDSIVMFGSYEWLVAGKDDEEISRVLKKESKNEKEENT